MDKISKAWDWKKNDENIWLEPSEESFYFCHIWGKSGYKDVLDFGCGLGRHSILFAKNDFNVSAFDLSQEGIEHLKNWSNEENLSIKMQVADMLSLPYEDKSFDCIFAYHVVSHTTTEGIKQIINEIERILKDKGELYITLCSKETWSFNHPEFPKIDNNTVQKIGGIEDGIPHFFVELDDIFELFKNFEIKNIRHTDDCYFSGKKQNSKHYFILAKK